ncbi:MAG: hypothetical protein KGJ79_03020 [Alphaproteobacteria bacterium]|nr:hypothetical protein [Alphaproteobacteria bacterium]MDE2110088.1 hypothetical protein [Alphaproteobacteria bacterium]MDE2495114.1 hypothetical protein [Alphaproteobacteria bacterium]
MNIPRDFPGRYFCTKEVAQILGLSRRTLEKHRSYGTGPLRFECKASRHEFSITSGTLFAAHKLPLRTYLAAIAVFCNEVKGKSALAISRDLGLSYKACFVLCHKLWEAMAEELKGFTVGGDGKVTEIDGGYFGSYVKPTKATFAP